MALAPALDGGFLAITKGPEFLTATRISKISPNGVIEWSKTIEGLTSFEAAALQLSLDGGAIMAGRTVVNNETQGLIIKLDRDFNIQWLRALQHQGPSAFATVHTTLTGDAIAGGWVTKPDQRTVGWVTKLDSLGATVWEQTYELEQEVKVQRILALDDGSSVFLANARELGSNATKMVIGALAGDGNLLWQKSVRASIEASGHDLRQRSDGSFIASASVRDEEGNDGLVVGFTLDGTLQTILRHGGPRNNQSLAVTSLGRDGYAVAGVSAIPDTVNSDMWIAVRRAISKNPVNPQVLAP